MPANAFGFRTRVGHARAIDLTAGQFKPELAARAAMIAQFIERHTVEHAAIHHHHIDFFGVADIL